MVGFNRLVLVGLLSLSGYVFCGHSPRNRDPSWVDIKECKRKCDGVPKTCYVKLTLERYMVLGPACGNCTEGVIEDCLKPLCITADGFHRSILTINRQLPGPPLEVCLNDKIVADIENNIPDEVTSMHWHGVRQMWNPHADGTAYVTQCPIIPATTYRYIFTPNIPGTFWYHSHVGLQKLDGLSGPLIVRDVKDYEPHGALYDEDLTEHVIFIKDWTHVPGEHMVMGLHSDKVSQLPDSLLINGRSTHYNSDGKIDLPRSEFVVEQGKRYRFRIVGATCMTCAVIVKFEGHSVIAIATDGGLNFQPVEVEAIYLNPGERYDVVLNASNPVGTYEISFQTVGPSCQPIIEKAILRYKSSKTNEIFLEKPIYSTNMNGLTLNNINSRCDGSEDNNLCISMLTGFSDAPKILDQDYYHQVELSLDLRVLDVADITTEGEYKPYDEPFKGSYQIFLLNNVTFVLPPAPVLTQPSDVPKDLLCSDDCKRGNSTNSCSCILLYSFPLNHIVDFIIIGGDITFAHPFHFHGYNLYVLEMGTFKDKENELADLRRRLRADEISTTLRPMKETINVPVQGYVAVRMFTDNPGYWIMHCHFAYHLGGGMAAVIQVGDPTIWPKTPKGYPTCGHFLPNDI